MPSVTFLEYWKRKSASLAHHWDCTGFQEEEQRPRPEFAARAPFLERNPITGVREPSFPSRLRHKRIAAGIGIIFLMMSLVMIFIVAVIIYRVLVSPLPECNIPFSGSINSQYHWSMCQLMSYYGYESCL
ncbi:anoctamin-7-like [Ischnura elegans]|uniref:anoctamin-7-like n=1 Tax=Ischnura elegans TaxID=197161 RepID=UPI001ED884ED|nr:anoctamin-7-like [Ischnura elegans]XP_046398219.1 anoctamin-7-like [Ischnura elegans]